jgi:hypothetical protein
MLASPIRRRCCLGRQAQREPVVPMGDPWMENRPRASGFRVVDSLLPPFSLPRGRVGRRSVVGRLARTFAPVTRALFAIPTRKGLRVTSRIAIDGQVSVSRGVGLDSVLTPTSASRAVLAAHFAPPRGTVIAIRLRWSRSPVSLPTTSEEENILMHRIGVGVVLASLGLAARKPASTSEQELGRRQPWARRARPGARDCARALQLRAGGGAARNARR